MSDTFSLDSSDAMHALGIELSSKYNTLLLEGVLGSGKTTLVQGFAVGLGIKEIVNSPTYTYMQSYDGKLLHIDMYNIESFDELVEKGIIDQIQEHEYIAIEWPKFVDQLGISGGVCVSLKKNDSSVRTAIISNI